MDTGRQGWHGGQLEGLGAMRPYPHLRHTRDTVVWAIPNSSASSREDQYGARSRAGGLAPSASVATSTATSSTVAGRPGRGRSPSAAIPESA